jgi:hypothetical protein
MVKRVPLKPRRSKRLQKKKKNTDSTGIRAHRFILKKFVDSSQLKRKEIIRNAPAVFFTVIRKISKKSPTKRQKLKHAILSAKTIKDYVLRNSSSVASLIKSVL